MKNNKTTATFSILIITMAVLISACNSKKSTEKQYFTAEGMIQGTYYSIKYEATENIDSTIYKELKKFDKSLSIYDSSSVISRINRNETAEVDSLFSCVFNRAQEISKETDGAFDMSVGPLVKLWGFNKGKCQRVTQAMIDSVLPYVGYQKVSLINKHISKSDPRLHLDANAIAQGFSCDIIAKLLDDKGCTNYMVEIGGEVRAKGINSKGNTWRIGLDKPIVDSTGTTSEIQEIVEIKNASVATSGNYRKFVIIDGVRYGHEIDPRNGRPVMKELLSTTIIAPDCMSADAYATACMIMGVEKSMQLCEKNKDIEGYFIYTDAKGQIQSIYTKGFEKYISKQ